MKSSSQPYSYLFAFFDKKRKDHWLGMTSSLISLPKFFKRVRNRRFTLPTIGTTLGLYAEIDPQAGDGPDVSYGVCRSGMAQ